MKLQNHDHSLAAALIKKIKGIAQPDYTMVSLGKISPLHNLAKEYKRKYPKRPVHSEIFISEITDPIAPFKYSSPKLWIEVKVVIKLMPDLIIKRLLDDPLIIKYNDGPGSFYDPFSMTISIKGAQDFIHEIGHHIWNTWLIRDDEAEKRRSVFNSFVDGAKSRKRLQDDLIPDSHKEYAELVGAWSGQFIENPETTKTGERRNDLEEHFARNFDYFTRGRMLDVTHNSNVDLDSLLDFYLKHGLSDEFHVAFYRQILIEGCGEERLNSIEPKNAKDGIPMTRDELFKYHKSRIMYETGRKLSLSQQIALALDLTEDFINFCISKNALTEIREAIAQKGVSVLNI